ALLERPYRVGVRLRARGRRERAERGRGQKQAQRAFHSVSGFRRRRMLAAGSTCGATLLEAIGAADALGSAGACTVGALGSAVPITTSSRVGASSAFGVAATARAGSRAAESAHHTRTIPSV